MDNNTYDHSQDTQWFALELCEQLNKIDALSDYRIEKFDLNPITQRDAGGDYFQIRVIDKEKLAGFSHETGPTLIVKENGVQFIAYTIAETANVTTLIVKENGVQFGRTLDGYIIPYTKGCHEPKEMALAIIKKLRELTNIIAVF
jgi:hypothetical protein